MPAPSSFDYAVIRVVPRVEREEFINAGVLVFCLQLRFLEARIHIDQQRLHALWPQLDLALVRVSARAEYICIWIFASSRAALACASCALAESTEALNGRGSILKSTCPFFRSAPSSKSRSMIRPATCGRTEVPSTGAILA